jgi:plastocyanin
MSRRALSLASRLGVAAALALSVNPATAALVSAQGQTLVIGVDHVDPANQDFAKGRLFEYTDFFTREVTVHQGDVVNFRTAPGAFHIVGLATNEAVARAVYPVAVLDTDDPNAPNGAPKIAFGPSNYPIVNGNTSGDLSGVDFSKPNGPPDCGRADLGEPDCTFSGGSDIEVAGPNLNFGATGPGPADWRVAITATPGTYTFLCFIHPGMRGTLNVVGAGRPTTTQEQIDHKSPGQFVADRAQGLAAEREANAVSFVGDAPGSRTYEFKVGIGAANNHVAIDEMFPNPATLLGGMPALQPGDKVRFDWVDPHNVHTVFFPTTIEETTPFGFDCDGGFTVPSGPPCLETGEFAPEVIGDPGNAPPGTLLTSPSAVVDSGLLIGTDYGLAPTVQTWNVATNSATAGGAYSFRCAVHDWMVGGFSVTGG